MPDTDPMHDPLDDPALMAAIFDLGEQIRYVAVADGPSITTRERAGLSAASSSVLRLLAGPACRT